MRNNIVLSPACAVRWLGFTLLSLLTTYPAQLQCPCFATGEFVPLLMLLLLDNVKVKDCESGQPKDIRIISAEYRWRNKLISSRGSISRLLYCGWRGRINLNKEGRCTFVLRTYCCGESGTEIGVNRGGVRGGASAGEKKINWIWFKWAPSFMALHY